MAKIKWEKRKEYLSVGIDKNGIKHFLDRRGNENDMSTWLWIHEAINYDTQENPIEVSQHASITEARKYVEKKYNQ